MTNIDPQTLVYGLLIAGYSFEALHCMLENCPSWPWSLRAVLNKIKGARLPTVLSIAGAFCIVCGYALVVLEKSQTVH